MKTKEQIEEQIEAFDVEIKNLQARAALNTAEREVISDLVGKYQKAIQVLEWVLQ